MRYVISGTLSAGAHIGTLAALVALDIGPVPASTIGFIFSIVVSYSLQRVWVFRSSDSHLRTAPRFALATLVAMILNSVIMTLGVEVFTVNYIAAQLVALILIPVSNYVINSSWTFAERVD